MTTLENGQQPKFDPGSLFSELAKPLGWQPQTSHICFRANGSCSVRCLGLSGEEIEGCPRVGILADDVGIEKLESEQRPGDDPPERKPKGSRKERIRGHFTEPGDRGERPLGRPHVYWLKTRVDRLEPPQRVAKKIVRGPVDRVRKRDIAPNEPPRLENAFHLSSNTKGIFQMLEDTVAGDRVETPVFKGKEVPIGDDVHVVVRGDIEIDPVIARQNGAKSCANVEDPLPLDLLQESFALGLGDSGNTGRRQAPDFTVSLLSEPLLSDPCPAEIAGNRRSQLRLLRNQDRKFPVRDNRVLFATPLASQDPSRLPQGSPARGTSQARLERLPTH